MSPFTFGRKISAHLMLVPSLACPAGCEYCFGPHTGDAMMSRETLEAVVAWQRALDGEIGTGNPVGEDDSAQSGKRAIELTFHGGEPLVPGASWYRHALPLLRRGLAPRRVRFAIQSNLWLLTDEIAEILREFGVALGTSLDGPEAINDAQRGRGYFARTMAGIEVARAHGLDVGVICTFTKQSAPKADEIFDFFAREGLNFSVHAALPSLRHPEGDRWSLSPQAHGELLAGLLDRYLENLTRIRIGTLDAMVRSVSAGCGGICTFTDCLGDYLAVGPDGSIYPCQRFAGMDDYILGNVACRPSLVELETSPVWKQFRVREETIAAEGQECSDCAYLAYCRGGCPYNGLVSSGGGFRRDPHCPSYRRMFRTVTERALEEMFSPENLDAVVKQPDPERGLMRRGPLLSLMADAPHPYQIASHARRIVAAVALAATGSPGEAARQLEQLGLTTNRPRSKAALSALHSRLTAPTSGLNNLYLHVTFACNLRCAHCYADVGHTCAESMSAGDLATACREAGHLGFRHAVITGGEPLIHPDRDGLLDALAALRAEVKPMLTVLRTSLAMPLDDFLLDRLTRSTDEIVVSVDGDRETHDERRGTGTYDLMVGNLQRLVAVGAGAEISLAAVLPLDQVRGPAGDSVRALAKELGIRRTRFRPLLPLGRALDSGLEITPETLWSHLEPSEMVAHGVSPTASCGMGQNLYVEPDGSAYPCYAWHGEGWGLGAILGEGGLESVIGSDTFQALRAHTVDTNRVCRGCSLRYLCGGACRAWNRAASAAQTDLDAGPVDCGVLRSRASSLLESALQHLGVSEAQWLAAGLPLSAIPCCGTSTRIQG
jgi:uncharacterized protein